MAILPSSNDLGQQSDYSVNGRIVHKETGLGLPNLVVTVIDADQKTVDFLTKIIHAYPQLGTQDLLFWKSLDADRLGSLVSGKDGSFVLQYQRQEFQKSNRIEVAPSLVVLVSAPETGTGNQLFQAPGSLLMYISAAPRFNASKNEYYLIELGSDVLHRHGIKEPEITRLPPNNPETEADLYERKAAHLLNSNALKKGIDQRLNREELERTKVLRENAKAFSERVTQLPESKVSGQGAYIAKLSDAPARMKEAGKNAVPVISTKTPHSQMTLTKPELLALGVKEEEIARLFGSDTRMVNVSTSYEKFCHLLKGKVGGAAVRKRTLAEAIDEILKENGQLEPTGVTDTSVAGSEPTAEEAKSLETILRELASAQSRDLMEEYRSWPEIDDDQLQERLNKKLQRFQVSSGPADTGAFHDFSTLQIAYPEIWYRAFDNHLKTEIERFYTSIVEETGQDFVAGDEEARMVSHPLALSEASVIRPTMPTLFDGLEDSAWKSMETQERWMIVGLANEKRNILRQMMAIYGKEETEDSTVGIFDEITDMNNFWARLDAEKINNDAKREKFNDIFRETQQIDDRVFAILSKSRPPKVAAARNTSHEVLDFLKGRLKTPYAFDVFAPDTYNFGIVTTYRQFWKPLKYQAGPLVASIPLAPGESKKYSRKTTLKKSSTRKEAEKRQTTRSDESTHTSRAEFEIASKAQQAMNFGFKSDIRVEKEKAKGKINFGASTEFGTNQGSESATAKKSFREAVKKAAQEYKSEREVEVSSTHEATYEYEETGEIKNPNNEITVTYLFYELERQYRIYESLHSVTPVVMVAQEVPSPDQINEEWVMAHEWILRRVLLDNSFNAAFDYLLSEIEGDEMIVRSNVFRANELRSFISDLKDTVIKMEADEEMQAEKLEEYTQTLAEKMNIVRAGKRRRRVGKYSVLVDQKASEVETIREGLEDIESKLFNANQELSEITTATSLIQKEILRKRGIVLQFLVHIKQNILHYMQAIWMHEHPDQLYFRLHDKDISVPKPNGKLEMSIRRVEDDAYDTLLNDFRRPEVATPSLPSAIKFTLDTPVILPTATIDSDSKKLREVAHIDQPLGFKGNYMIFPAKGCMYLTDFMVKGYIDDYFGVRDPDQSGDYDPDELIHKVRELVSEGKISVAQWEAIRPQLASLLQQGSLKGEVVSVPTGQLFIEALPGSHSVLEPYKLHHRALDVRKAQGELIQQNIENLRRAQRIAGGDLADPEVDKYIQIEGNAMNVDIDPD